MGFTLEDFKRYIASRITPKAATLPRWWVESAILALKPVTIHSLLGCGHRRARQAWGPQRYSRATVEPKGSMPILTPSTGAVPHQANTFDVSLIVPVFAGMTFTIGAIQVFESSLTVQNIQALIGRDVLTNCLLVYDGRNDIFSLAF